jgi:hypothetical protein
MTRDSMWIWMRIREKMKIQKQLDEQRLKDGNLSC